MLKVNGPHEQIGGNTCRSARGEESPFHSDATRSMIPASKRS